MWALQISGIGTLLTGINFVTTILKMRAPGMTLMRMPIFCWTALAASLLIVAAFPILTATFAMLLLDRYLGFHFFTDDGRRQSDDVREPHLGVGSSGGLYPDPAGVRRFLRGRSRPSRASRCSAIARWSSRPWRSASCPSWSGCIISSPWAPGADVNGFFGIMTMIIAVPTGVKIFNWLFTMWGGRVRFELPMLWALGFMVTFVIGGMTGVLLAVPPADFVLHNSLFLVAHFHNVDHRRRAVRRLRRLHLLVPQGVRLQARRARSGKAAFWCWVDRLLRRLHAALRRSGSRA